MNIGLTLARRPATHEASQYFALMIVPVLGAACRFSFLGTLVISTNDE
jgi:hypothetical protein